MNSQEHSFPHLDIITILERDYQQFPNHQTYSIYAEDVYFQDPLNRFRGLKRYQQMIGFISTWFQDIQLDLHDIKFVDKTIHTQWTLCWTTPLPWQPRITIPGRSELVVNEAGMIASHIDYWHCSRLNVLKQHVISSKLER